MSAIDYAKEVYAACATVGFTGASARRLKALLDRFDRGERDLDAIVEAAQEAQRESVAWAGRVRNGP